jgi:hypothetical protein
MAYAIVKNNGSTNRYASYKLQWRDVRKVARDSETTSDPHTQLPCNYSRARADRCSVTYGEKYRRSAILQRLVGDTLHLVLAQHLQVFLDVRLASSGLH